MSLALPEEATSRHNPGLLRPERLEEKSTPHGWPFRATPRPAGRGQASVLPAVGFAVVAEALIRQVQHLPLWFGENPLNKRRRKERQRGGDSRCYGVPTF